MKTTIMRSAAALISAAILLTGLNGCGRIDGSRQGGLEVSLDHAYSAEKLNLEGISQPHGGLELGGKLLVEGTDEGYNTQFCLYDLKDGSTQPFVFQYLTAVDPNADVFQSAYFVDENGDLNVIFNGYMMMTDENGEMSYEPLPPTVEVYDSEMNATGTYELDLGLEEGSSFGTIVSSPAGGYFITTTDQNGELTIGMYDKDFQRTGQVDANIQHLTNIFAAKNGSVIIAYEDASWTQAFAKVDPGTGKVTNVTIQGLPQWFNKIIPSTDAGYDFYVCDSAALYGINCDAGTCEEVVNWLNSDFMGSNVSEVRQLEDGRFLITNAPMKENAVGELWLLTKRDPDAFKNVTMISMAALSLPDELAEAVLQFNRTHDDARIAVVNYDKYNTEDDHQIGMKRLQTDMTSGIVADLICTTGLPYESLANKGIFEELSDYIKDYTEADYFTDLFDSMRYGDKLYHLGFSYDVQTLEGKKDFVGDKQGLTKTEFMDLVSALPADMALFEDATKSRVLEAFVVGDIKSYTDVASGSANFDTPDFAATLDFCNRFPSEAKDISKMEDAELNAYWDESQFQYINNKTAIRSVYYSDVKSVYRSQFQYFGDAEINRIGYPINSENGGNGGRFQVYNTVAMSSNSKVKEQCWEFMRYMFSDEYQDGLSWSLPIKKSAFDKMVETAMTPITYKDENGDIQEMEDTIYRGDEEIVLPKMPQSFADELKAYIEGVRVCTYYDVQVYQIINEETQMFFSGDQNAKHTAEMIQSRVSIYLAEQS